MRQTILALVLAQFLFYQDELPIVQDDDPEPQHLSWELGEPDNQVETEVIYEPASED
jgi:hypothetical protein